MSPDLIEHAIKTGHYKPAKAGDYSDFSFRKAYQPIERRSADWNKDRAQTAWEMLMGKETMDQEAFPYSVKPTKKLTVSDVQKIVSGPLGSAKPARAASSISRCATSATSARSNPWFTK